MLYPTPCTLSRFPPCYLYTTSGVLYYVRNAKDDMLYTVYSVLCTVLY